MPFTRGLHFLFCLVSPDEEPKDRDWEPEEAPPMIDDIELERRRRKKERRREIPKMAAPRGDDIELFEGSMGDRPEDPGIKGEAPIDIDEIGGIDGGSRKKKTKGEERGAAGRKQETSRKRAPPVDVDGIDDEELEMPRALLSVIEDLRKWQKANRKDVTKDRMKFWVLKLPAIISMITSGVFTYLDLEVAQIIATSIAGACVIADGIIHPGELYRVHLRTVHDLGQLVMRVKMKWLIGIYGDKDREELMKETLEYIQGEFDRISEKVENAEAQFNVTEGSGNP